METLQFESKKVYDPFLRLLHAWNALAITGLIATAWVSELFEKGPGEKTIWILHIFIGYALILGFGLRILWGLIGPEHARLKNLWHFSTWNSLLKSTFSKSKNFVSYPRQFGHDPKASILYITTYIITFGMILSGLFLAAIEHGLGPLAHSFFDQVDLKHAFKEPHEIGSFFLVGFIVLHIGAILWHEKFDKTPISQSMISGYQYRRIKTDSIFWAVIGSLTILGLNSKAYGTTPYEIIQGYSQEAKAVNPSFKNFSKEMGNRFYHLERKHSDGKTVSCATCHTNNPREKGLSRANKVIDAMAPSINPKRFTDLTQIEKWFRRNCMDVLERPCTVQEKGDFIEYLKSL